MNPTEPTLVAATQQSWHRFLESFGPLRPDLYRFCRLLTRGFAAMSRLAAMPSNPRAWLFRVATNAWIDATRRPAATPGAANENAVAEPVAAADPEPGALHDATGSLLVRLSPQERAALVPAAPHGRHRLARSRSRCAARSRRRAQIVRDLRDPLPPRAVAGPEFVEQRLHALPRVAQRLGQRRRTGSPGTRSQMVAHTPMPSPSGRPRSSTTRSMPLSSAAMTSTRMRRSSSTSSSL